MKKSFLTVFSAVFMFIAAILAVSCGGGGGGGAIAATGGNNKGKHFGSGTESGSKIQLTSSQLFEGETASMMATTPYDFIRLKVSINGEEKIYQIKKSENIELNIGTTIGDKLQMYAEICDASGTVLRTATSDPITIGLGKNDVVMYITYFATLHHADGTTSKYPFTSRGSTLPADSATYTVSGYIFNAWASGPSDGSYDGMNASGVFTNSIAPGTRNDVELYAHWKLAPLEDGGVPVPGKHYANYYIDPNGAPTRVPFTEGVGIASLLNPTAPAGFADGTFGGWYTDFVAGTGVSGSQITSISPTETADVNLYAKWTFPVNYYSNPTGDASSSGTYQYGAGLASLAGTPSLPAGYALGAEFKGWYPKDNYSASTGAGGVKATSISATQTGKVEYVARWEYKVTLYNNPLDLTDTTEETYVKETGCTLSAGNVPSAWGGADATFKGWYGTAPGGRTDSAIAGLTKKDAGDTISQGNETLYAYFTSPYKCWYDISSESGYTSGNYYIGTVDYTTQVLITPNNTQKANLVTAFGSGNCALADWYPTCSKTAGSADVVSYIDTTSPFSGTAVTKIDHTTDYGEKTFYAKYTINTSNIVYNTANYDLYKKSTIGFNVYTAAQIEALMSMSMTDSKTFAGATITIQNDITYGNSQYFKNFEGTLDGNNKKLNCYSGYYLVRSLDGGTIKNLKVSGLISENISGNTAGIAAVMTAGEITNCVNVSNISAGGMNVGGIVGYATGGTITKCSNEGSYITGGSSANIGGIVGYAGSGVIIQQCYNAGEIKSGAYAGGIAGYVDGGSIKNCYNTGTVGDLSTIFGAAAGFITGGRLESFYKTDGSLAFYGEVLPATYNPKGNCFGSIPTATNVGGALSASYWMWDGSKPVLKGVGTDGGWPNH